MAQLDPELLVKRSLLKHSWYDGPTPGYRLCFGFGFTTQRMLDYALRAQLVKTVPSHEDPAALTVIKRAKRHLERLIEAPLDLRAIIHREYELCFSLYSNYTKWCRELEETDEKEVVEIIKKELHIPEDVAPMWYHQITDVD